MPQTLRVLVVLGSLAGAASYAQDTRVVTEPVFPPICTSLTAQLAAGRAGLPPAFESLFDTSRIQSALNACPAGKAVDLQSSGSSNGFLIAPITLPKGVTLLVDAGVTVFASRNPRDYDADGTNTCGAVVPTGGGCKPLITVNRADGAGLMGYGTIDGRGGLPVLLNGTPSMSWWDLGRLPAPPPFGHFPKILQVTTTNNFTLYKITLINGMGATAHVTLNAVSNSTVWGIKIISPDGAHSSGILLDYSNNVSIANSYISDGDDIVAISADGGQGASNISVINSQFGDGHGAAIGSYTQTGISNVVFDGISFTGGALNSGDIGIRIKSDVSRGGLIQNVTYSNICMQNVRTPIILDPFYTVNATGNLVPQFKNIMLQNVHATTEGLVKIEGHDANNPTTITLNNVQIDGIKSADITAEYTNFTLGPDPVNFASLLKGTGVTVTNTVANANPPKACPASVFSPVAGELIPGPSQIAAAQNLAVQVQILTTKDKLYDTYLTNLKTDPNATFTLTAPTGLVTIYDGTASLATVALGGDPLLGVALPNLAVGTHTLTAAYSGDSNYAGFAFGNYQVDVVDHFDSATTLKASAATATVGDTLTLTAVVSGSGGIPTGSATFMDGETTLAVIPLDSSGTAIYSTGSLPGGTNTITAAYGGDAMFAGSASVPVVLNISQAASTVTLAADNIQIAPGQAVTLTATVSASSTPFPFTGTLNFVDGSTVLGTVNLDANGAATYSTDTLEAGVHSLVASYPGDPNFAPATSPVLTVQVVDQTASSRLSKH